MDLVEPEPQTAPPPHRLTATMPEASAMGGAAFCFGAGETIAAAGAPIRLVRFVTGGLAAALARAGGGAAEVGLIGPGGLIGERAALGATRGGPEVRAVTEVAGFEIDVDRFEALRAERPDFARDVRGYLLERMEESERLCACAALHPIDRRIARWLTRAHDLSGEEAIAITHSRFAAIFGVRRASVTTSLHMLEGKAAVRCRRGRIEIRDPARLAALSCGCHRAR